MKSKICSGLQNPKLPRDDLQNWLKYPATGRRRHGSEYLLYNAIDNEGTLDGHASITDQDVYVLLSKIPPGKVSIYGDIAKALGHPKAARVIGRIIANNLNPISIPCHRIVKSNGEIGGFAYGEQRKREILEKEGIKFQNRIGKL